MVSQSEDERSLLSRVRWGEPMNLINALMSVWRRSYRPRQKGNVLDDKAVADMGMVRVPAETEWIYAGPLYPPRALVRYRCLRVEDDPISGRWTGRGYGGRPKNSSPEGDCPDASTPGARLDFTAVSPRFQRAHRISAET